MNEASYHYKENNPESTVANIRSLLFRNNISVIEKEWRSSQDCYHSLSLKVEGTPFSVNGKGVTSSLALASAHGELMERLQNMTVFKLIYDFSKTNFEEHGYYFAPDEKLIKPEEFLENSGPWLSSQISTMEDKSTISELLKKWQSISFGNYGDSFISLPFLHVNSGKVDTVPIIMLSKMYTSNGMAAGNTIDEALVQGISEIYERYATVQILQNKICPPDIPHSEIEQNSNLRIMVQAIEFDGRYRLYFKDCSMGIGLPVVAVICVDTQSGKYFVKFGAHPIFEIAVERTMTELLQGQNLNEMKGMRPYSHDTAKACSKNNIYGIMLNGCGSYPYTFFSEDGDYDYIPFSINEKKDNAELMRKMVEDIIKRGWDLFVRDVSFLGFPSYQIIISGISEVEPFDDIKVIEEYASYCKTKKNLKNIKILSKQQIRDIAVKIDGVPHLKNVPPSDWLHLEKDSSAWIYENSYWLTAALYILADEIGESARVLTNFLVEYDRYGASREPCYFRCAAAYLSMKSDNMREDEIILLLGKFYPNRMIKEVIFNFSKEELISLFNYLDVKEGKKNKLLILYNKLNMAYCNNKIIQNKLIDMF